jgi:hypothetical protein
VEDLREAEDHKDHLMGKDPIKDKTESTLLMKKSSCGGSLKSSSDSLISEFSFK